MPNDITIDGRPGRLSMPESRSALHEKGMAVIRVIGIEGFDTLSAALDNLDADFKRLLVEGAYAEIIARPTLSLEHRELVTVAVLATMGNAESALRYHAGGMLNTGWTPHAVLETILHTSVYAGVPVAIAGVRAVQQLFAERGIALADEEPADTRGESHVTTRPAFQRDGKERDVLPDEIRNLLAELTYGRASNLTVKERRLATLAIVIARQNRPDAIRQHLKRCASAGWTRGELTEVLIQMTGYIGWPLVLAMTRIALDVFAETMEATEAMDATDAADDPVERQSASHARASALPPFSIPAYIAELSPRVAGYLSDFDITQSRVQPLEQAKAGCLTDIACLTCLSRNADTEVLSAQVRQALSLGLSPKDITEAVTKALPHAGVLAVEHGLRVANRVIEERADSSAHEQTHEQTHERTLLHAAD